MPTRVDVLRHVPNDQVEQRVRIIRRDPRVVSVEVEADGPGTSRITVTMEIPAPRTLAKPSRKAAKPKPAKKATKRAAKAKSAAKPKKASKKAKETSTPRKRK